MIENEDHGVTHVVFLPVVFPLNLKVGSGEEAYKSRQWDIQQDNQILLKNENVMKDESGNETAEDLRRLKRHDHERRGMILVWFLDLKQQQTIKDMFGPTRTTGVYPTH